MSINVLTGDLIPASIAMNGGTARFNTVISDSEIYEGANRVATKEYVDQQDYTAFEVLANDTAIAAGTVDSVTGLTYTNAVSAGMTHRMTIRTSCTDLTNLNVKVDWGDGIIDDLSATYESRIDPDSDEGYRFVVAHSYTAAGRYVVKVIGSQVFYIIPDTSNNLICRAFEADLPISRCIKNISSFCHTALRILRVNGTYSSSKPPAFYNASAVFAGCSNLKSVSWFGLWDAGIAGVSGIFNGCTALQTVSMTLPHDFSSASQGIKNAFVGCSSLAVDIASLIPATGFTAKTINARGVFQNCANLTGTVPANLLWGDTSIEWTDTATAFLGCSAAIRAQVPTTWGGTAYATYHSDDARSTNVQVVATSDDIPDFPEKSLSYLDASTKFSYLYTKDSYSSGYSPFTTVVHTLTDNTDLTTNEAGITYDEILQRNVLESNETLQAGANWRPSFALTDSEKFFISFWFRPFDYESGTQARIFNLRDGSNNGNFSFGRDVNGVYGLQTNAGSTMAAGNYFITIPDGVIKHNKWNHIVIAESYTASHVFVVYVNGSSNVYTGGTSSFTGNNIAVNFHYPVWAGAASKDSFPGRFALIRIGKASSVSGSQTDLVDNLYHELSWSKIKLNSSITDLTELTANDTMYPDGHYYLNMEAPGSCTINAASVTSSSWLKPVATAEFYIYTGACTFTAGTNLTLVNALQANKTNHCSLMWFGGTCRMYVIDAW